MIWISEAYSNLQSFFDAGGPVLFVVLFVTILMWTFIVERMWYFWKIHPEAMDNAIRLWESRSDRDSWYARRIRDRMISEISVDVNRFVLFIKTLIAILPLVGLMGTVTGMILVFDVMAIFGTGNARLMASGVSAATIPTMSGMVAALSGLYFGAWLERKAKIEVEKAEDWMRSA